MTKIKIIFVLTLISILTIPAFSFDKSDLNASKMKSVTTDILDLFVSGKSDNLRKYISREWLDDKEISVSKYKINNYSPTYYDVHYAGGDICVATIGGEGWMHLLVFKFTNEAGTYRVVPHGFAESNKEYIDPWWHVSAYIGNKEKEDK
jgi:uncharacterized membrane protein